jgi:uncharacterized protein YyaL (SSP411 family)
MSQNRLAQETSPYLIQHKDNPVAWRPWGPEALAEAKRTGKPILLSIGYAACHWCHVMAHESFEDEATAAVMNELYVNIKVDREERPDIDEIYMRALQLMGEQGGWPLTMFLTPDAEPFWGGTYFPKQASYGRPGFQDVLKTVSRVFHNEPGKVEENRKQLAKALQERARVSGAVKLGIPELNRAAEQIGGLFDPVHGGLRGAPKFPQCAMLEFLWRAGERTGEERYYAVAERTLDRMSQGGIYDHLGGGYARYSVDERWLAPHFEKMLYDNAQILELLALAFARTGDILFRDRARETVEWLAREMTTPEGAFASSLDADSEGEEGKFYLWSVQQIRDALGDKDGEFFAKHYDVSEGGNFEHANILNRLNRLPRSKENPSRSNDDETRLANLRAKLLEVRARRVRPGLDDKVLADWNGLMIAALANAGALMNEPEWIARGEKAFAFIAANMTKGDRLGHSWRAGRSLFPGLSSDFAAMIRAAIMLHQVTGKKDYLDHARRWSAALEEHHYDSETHGYFLTAADAEGLIVRPALTRDDALPNPNGVQAQNLIRLALLAGDDSYRARADKLLEGLLPLAAESVFNHMTLLSALDLRLRHLEIVAAGNRAEEFAKAALKISFLDRTLLRVTNADALPTSHPARTKLDALKGEAAAFVCQGERCSLPVTEPDKLAAAAAANFAASR